MADAPPAVEAPPAQSPLGVETVSDPFQENPALFVGGAFVGGLALAMILRKLGPDD